MPTDKRRITIIPDAGALAVLGYDLADAPITEAVTTACRTAARLVAGATRELEAVLSRAEWNAIADVMNGTADLYDYAGLHAPALMMVAANLLDSPGIGKKWKVDVGELVAKVNALTPTHGEAILAAVRWFWGHPDRIDHAKDEWWKAGGRVARPTGGG